VYTKGSFLSEILGTINELIQSLLAKENKIGTTNVTMTWSRMNIFLETNASAFAKYKTR
jgi:hypothetical protein